MQTIGSSNAPNLEGRFAVDNNLQTWWQPAADDKQSNLTTIFLTESTVNPVRVIWRDVGLDTSRNVTAGPIRYRIDLEVHEGQWVTIVDASQNQRDLLIDYRQCKPTVGKRARLVILESPKGITPAVTEFTLFGNAKESVK